MVVPERIESPRIDLSIEKVNSTTRETFWNSSMFLVYLVWFEEWSRGINRSCSNVFSDCNALWSFTKIRGERCLASWQLFPKISTCHDNIKISVAATTWDSVTNGSNVGHSSKFLRSPRLLLSLSLSLSLARARARACVYVIITYVIICKKGI